MFDMNGKTYKTDAQTLADLCEHRDAGNKRIVSIIFQMGFETGKILEVK